MANGADGLGFGPSGPVIPPPSDDIAAQPAETGQGSEVPPESASYQIVLIVSPIRKVPRRAGSETMNITGGSVCRGPNGVSTAVMERDCPSFMDALRSAMADARTAGYQIRRVEPDDFVTQAEIAERLGRTSESVRLLTSGRRGKATFPRPAVRVSTRGSLWRWWQVAVWAGRPDEEVERAERIAAANALLDLDTFDAHSLLEEVSDSLELNGPSA